MAEAADQKIVNLVDWQRYRPANSNDAARAGLCHHFCNVPHCSFAQDHAISMLLASHAKVDSFPSAPILHTPISDEVPSVAGDTPERGGSIRTKLLRSGFALSVLLHAAAAFAVGYATIRMPEEATLIEGITIVAMEVQGDSDADARAAGEEEPLEKPEPIEKIEPKPEEVKPEPVEQKVEPEKPLPEPEAQEVVLPEPKDILKDIPMPQLGAMVPEVLTTTQPAEQQVEATAKVPVEEVKEEQVEPKPEPEAVLPKPEEVRPKPVERKIVEKKPEPKLEKPIEKKSEPKPEKKRPEHKKSRAKGNQGDQQINARRGDADAKEKGERASENSRGNSTNREKGNASSSNYKGLVQKKLQRAKGRVASPGKGKVTVQFTIAASGAVSDVRVVQSSGKPALDAAALKIVRAASPFPPIPADAGRKTWKMSVPISFK